MLLIILKIVLLHGVIIIPLTPPKTKAKHNPVSELKMDTNTEASSYAIDENGNLNKN
ncbi:hypothetical protein [Mucilaginibacter sp.]|uniref:hypothetical protein n=1 Tax=Mucilaginibacter sp. TaxID=1882438 RepID=UPI002625E8B4|nr:hypothetical protein [Mucilaginibacter sp.]MDB4918783.1 hypothetical protein [Mucilaginibacter sp.]